MITAMCRGQALEIDLLEERLLDRAGLGKFANVDHSSADVSTDVAREPPLDA